MGDLYGVPVDGPGRCEFPGCTEPGTDNGMCTGHAGSGVPDPTVEYRIVTEEGFPHGLRCPSCDRVLAPGQPFIAHPLSTHIEIITCVYCTA